MQDWEELYDSHKENLEIHDMECELFGGPLDNDELANELDALVALDAANEIADLEPVPLIITAKKQPAQQVEEDSEEEEVAVKPKRQMMAA